MSCSWYDCFLEFCFCKKGLLLQIYEKNRKIGEVGEIEEISVIGVIGEIGVIKKYSTYNTYNTIAPIHKKPQPHAGLRSIFRIFRKIFSDSGDSSTKEIV
jgi:hypothetical protein